MIIPVPAQNSCLREYIQKKGGTYILPPLESYYHGCYHQLFGLLWNLPEDRVVIMYSLSMLPIDNTKKMNEIIKISSKKKIKYAFVLENFESSLSEIKFADEANSYILNRVQSNISAVIKYFNE